MQAVVSGGAGFIGSHLVERLLDEGAEVTVIDDLSTGSEQNLAAARERGARLVIADVSDPAAIGPELERLRPELIFHLAAQVDVRISVAEPVLDTRINVGGTVSMLEAARLCGCKRFLFASSCAIYGEPDVEELPVVEAAPPRPLAPYGQAKLAGEGYLSMYRRLHGLETTSLRFGNVYGPRQSALGEAGVVSIFSRAMRDGIVPTVFGSGRQTRDYIYVGDVVAALLAASQAPPGGPGELNVGTGIETTVLELLEVLSPLAGRAGLEPTMEPERAGEVDRITLDPALTRKTLGWEAATSLAEGLPITWEAIAAED